MAKAFFRQNPTSLTWEYGSFKADGETPDIEYTIPAGLFRARWETMDGVVKLTLVNANNLGELNPIRNIPITEVAKDLIGTAYADRAEFETANKDFFFRVGGVISSGYTILGSSVGSRYRTGIRSDQYVIDKELTATGFSGDENTDWENVFGAY